MSEKTKRVNKTEDEIRKDLMDKKAENFRAKLRALEDEFDFMLEPTLHFSHRGIVPTINVVERPKKAETKQEDKEVV